ncbi:MAG: hypothetical protein R3C10_04290 [Pirellulales bacterium]
MSSNELGRIFEGAAALVEARLASEPGVSLVLAELAKRIPDAGDDPRTNRRLFFEPRIDSQQLGVSRLTAEKVAVLLHRFGVFHLWARVTCPSVGEDEAGTIVESDDADEVRSALDRSCDHCGVTHVIADVEIESVYAFATKISDDPQDFDFAALELEGIEEVVESQGSQEPARLAVLAPLESPKSEIRLLLFQALAANSDPRNLPQPREVYFDVWKGPLLLLLLYIIGIVPVARMAGPVIAYIVSAVFLILGCLILRATVQARLAPTAVQRTAMYLGMPVGIGCFVSGVSGFRLIAEAGQEVPWWSRIEFGETSYGLTILGLFLIVVVLGFVLIYDGKIGWLR